MQSTVETRLKWQRKEVKSKLKSMFNDATENEQKSKSEHSTKKQNKAEKQ